MVDDHHDDGESTEKIETRLTFTIGKARVDSEPEWRGSFAHRIRTREISRLLASVELQAFLKLDGFKPSSFHGGFGHRLAAATA